MLKLVAIDLEVEHLEFRHIVDEVAEVERLKGMGGWILHHTDCAAGVDYEYFRSILRIHVV